MIQHPKINNNKQDSKGYTGLSLADQVGLTEIVEKILEFHDILVDTADQSVKQTALMFAAERNHREVIRFLLRGGAKLNLKNINNSTAVLLAAAEAC